MMRRQVLEKMPGKRAIVTGGSKGVGAVIARTLAEAGLHLAIVGRDEAGCGVRRPRLRRQDQCAW
jgi:short-subunit dehydrogenase